jgi:hypothetical protein
MMANNIETPFKKLENMHIIGKVDSYNLNNKNRWLKEFNQKIVLYLEEKGFQKSLGRFYKKNTKLSLKEIQANKSLVKKYDTLATQSFDLKDPTLKMMVNYLNNSYPDYEELVQKRESGITNIKNSLMKKSLHISHNFFIHKNGYSGLDLTFTQLYMPIEDQIGGKFRVGIFKSSNEKFLFIEDSLSKEKWLDTSTSQMLNKLKNIILVEINSFYKPQKLKNYTFVEKKEVIINADKLVTSVVPDDSDSSKVECDPELTLNNENVTTQLKKINKYIYKVSPYYEAFKLPNKSEGVVWESFYWKHKKVKLLKKLSKIGKNKKVFLDLLSNFIDKERNILKRYFANNEFIKIDKLFQEYWIKHKIKDKKIDNFLLSVDTVDIIALGLGT